MNAMLSFADGFVQGYLAGQRAAYLAEWERVDEALWRLALEWEYQMRSGEEEVAQRVVNEAASASHAWSRLRALAGGE